ncbi:MAG: hypothetical protein K5770_01810 [Lachnospiraceae bacterium]|nr:hypothetical protein [Lachnospiraceae bacterium]
MDSVKKYLGILVCTIGIVLFTASLVYAGYESGSGPRNYHQESLRDSLTGSEASGFRTASGEKEGNIMKIVIEREDGIQVLIKEGTVYTCNTGLSFIIKEQGCEYYEYSISGDGGNNYSKYLKLKADRLSLKANDRNKAEGLWYIHFRGLDSLHNVVLESEEYAVLFDAEAPDIEMHLLKDGEEVRSGSDISQETAPGTGNVADKSFSVIRIKAADDKSGLKYIELRKGNKSVYKRNYYDAVRKKVDFLVRLYRGESDPHEDELEFIVGDRAGNTERKELGSISRNTAGSRDPLNAMRNLYIMDGSTVKKDSALALCFFLCYILAQAALKAFGILKKHIA